MKRAALAREVVRRLRREMPGATTGLKHRSAFQLLIATILSAQTTDEQVNRITPALFKRYPTAKKLAAAPVSAIEKLVGSVNFFRTKARNLSKTAKLLVSEHGGRVPADLESLVKLPGVARKTANVVLGTWHKIPAGIVVDTHVFRVTARLGLANEKTPQKTEVVLLKFVPKEDWIDLGHLLIWHGRRVCDARKPECSRCTLADLCPSADVSRETT